MKIYDLSHDLLTVKSYSTHPPVIATPLHNMEAGEVYNLTQLTLSTHNGSHLDAPRHFYRDGRTIDQVELNKCVGECTLMEHKGIMTEQDVEVIAKTSKRKLLIRGDIEITNEAAKAFVAHGYEFIGVEGVTVGPEKAPMAVHLTLLHPDAEVVIAENLNLTDVPVGDYFLCCPPLKLGGLDGSPCRPILIEF